MNRSSSLPLHVALQYLILQFLILQYSPQLQNLSLEHLLGVSTVQVTFVKTKKNPPSDWKPRLSSLPLPRPRLPNFPSPLLLLIISLHSYVIIGLGKEFQGCRLSEQHYAKLSSRVISDANTCPPGECELSLLVSARQRRSI